MTGRGAARGWASYLVPAACQLAHWRGARAHLRALGAHPRRARRARTRGADAQHHVPSNQRALERRSIGAQAARLCSVGGKAHVMVERERSVPMPANTAASLFTPPVSTNSRSTQPGSVWLPRERSAPSTRLAESPVRLCTVCPSARAAAARRTCDVNTSKTGVTGGGVSSAPSMSARARARARALSYGGTPATARARRAPRQHS